jgi:uncharacterized protein (TIGR03067 family)
MPDNFQAEPARWSSQQLPAFDRHAEINIRKQEKRIVRRVIISVSGVLMAGVVLGLLIYKGKTTHATVAASSSGPVSIPEEEVRRLEGTWVATAATINGEEATDNEVAKIKLIMGKDGFRMVLPTNQKEGDCWITGCRTPNGIKGILFLARVPTGGDFVPGMRAIYERDGDFLKMCITGLSDKWPDDFTATKDSKRTLLILKRKEP